MFCEQQHFVDAYHDDQLNLSQRSAFEIHLRNCAACEAALQDLRSISQKLSEADFPEISNSTRGRYHQAWQLANQRSVLRISSWLTGAAAAVLVGSLLLWPDANQSDMAVAARPSNWELVAMMPPQERTTDRPDELIELAQWMADDLSASALDTSLPAR